MGKNIVSFEDGKKKKPARLVPSLSKLGANEIAEDYGWNYEDFKKFISYADGAVKNVLEKVDIGNAKFEITDVALNEALNMGLDCLSGLTSVSLEYEGIPGTSGDTDVESYLIPVCLFRSENAVSVGSTILKRTNKGIYSLRADGKTWENTPEKEKILEIINDGTEAESDFIYAYANIIGIHPVMLGNEDLNFFRASKPLIKLYDRLHGLADYDFIEIEDPKKGQPPVRALLVPDDIYRVGGAVFWKNGKFHICQNMDKADTEEALFAEPENMEFGIFEENIFPFHNEVFSTTDANQVIRSLRLYWDHYSGNETMFNFPISENAYAESRRPYNKLNVFTRGGKRPLTMQEEASLLKLKKFFGLK